MLEQVVNTSVIDVSSRAMAASTLRHEVLSNNIANVNTPNFKRSHVRFEDLLMPVVRTHDRHLPLAYRGKAHGVIEQENTTNMRLDGNNVDIDVEMAEVAKNQLYYNVLANQLGGHISRMKSVITSGQG